MQFNDMPREFSLFTEWAEKPLPLIEQDDYGYYRGDCFVITGMKWKQDGMYIAKGKGASCSKTLSVLCQHPYCDADERNSTCFNEMSYKLFTKKKTWEDANKLCKNDNGTLAILNSKDINDHVLKLCKKE